MKRILSVFTYGLSLFVLPLLFVSCNLFITEEPETDDYGFSDVPVHTGEGYDKPVTTTDGNCEVTYQLKNNVRQLTLEDTQQWITYVEQDNTGLFLEIHYSAHTPSDRLPMPGEILLCTDVQTFPMGCMHRVQMRELRDGEYCYIASLAQLDETYQVLDISGAITTKDEEEYDLEPEAEDSTATARQTRATDFNGDGWYGIGGMHVKLGDEFGLAVEFPTSDPILEIKDDKHKDHPIKAEFLEGSNYINTIKLDFTDFSLSRNVYKIRYTDTEDVTLKMKVTGSYEGTPKIRHYRPVKGKPVVVGPVVLVLFINLNFDMEFKATAEVTLERHYVSTLTYDIDLSEFTLNKSEKCDDSGWKVDAVFSGDIGVRSTLELGMGLYGKILSVRLQPSVYTGIHAQTAPIVLKGEEDYPTYDISSRPGLTWKLEWQLDAGIFVELSVFDWLKEFFDKLTKGNVKSVLSDVAKQARENSDWYKEYSADFWNNNDPSAYQRDEVEDKTGVTTSFGPWNIVKPKNLSWFPTIDDNTFHIDRQYNEDTHTMEFVGQYTIRSNGFFGLFNSYVPGMIIKKGTKVVEVLYPEDEGRSARTKADKTYTFKLPNYEDDQTYMAVPCYYCMPLSHYNPDAIDKGLPFMGTTPSVTVHMIKPTGAEVKQGMFFDNYGEESYDYMYIYNFDVQATVRGADNIKKWGIYEGRYSTSFDYKPKEATALGDGTYVLHCQEVILSNTPPQGNWHRLRIYPFFFSDEKTGNEYHTGTTTILTINPEGFYKLDDGDMQQI